MTKVTRYLVCEKGSSVPIVSECTRLGAEELIKAYKAMSAKEGKIVEYEIIVKEIEINGRV